MSPKKNTRLRLPKRRSLMIVARECIARTTEAEEQREISLRRNKFLNAVACVADCKEQRRNRQRKDATTTAAARAGENEGQREEHLVKDTVNCIYTCGSRSTNCLSRIDTNARRRDDSGVNYRAQIPWWLRRAFQYDPSVNHAVLPVVYIGGMTAISSSAAQQVARGNFRTVSSNCLLLRIYRRLWIHYWQAQL